MLPGLSRQCRGQFLPLQTVRQAWHCRTREANVRVGGIKLAVVSGGGFDLGWLESNNLRQVIAPATSTTHDVVLLGPNHAVVPLRNQLFNPLRERSDALNFRLAVRPIRILNSQEHWHIVIAVADVAVVSARCEVRNAVAENGKVRVSPVIHHQRLTGGGIDHLGNRLRIDTRQRAAYKVGKPSDRGES